MKGFTKKGIKYKALIAITTVIMLLQFVVPNISQAKDDWGGKLFTPIQKLVLAIGDAGEWVLNKTVMQSSEGAVLSLDSKDGFKLTAKEVVMLITNPVMGQNYIAAQWLMHTFSGEDFNDSIDLPVMQVTPDKIFTNQIPLLDVNIISPNTTDGESSASILQPVVSSWYKALRNIATVGFLSVLVYVGIRIITSSTAADKSKYKQMLVDWIVGLCLLFVMHYIMSFSFIVLDKINGFVSSTNSEYRIQLEMSLDNFEKDAEEQQIIQKYNSGDTLNWKTDLAGYIRFFAQDNIKSMATPERFGYVVMYVVMVIYTYMFLFQYLRRLLNIILLAILAPFVAFTYPIDKFSDGKAQAFNMWMKEFTFNLLLQPMHLILYSVFVGSAIELASKHPIYAIVVMGFLLQAEKFVRKMFKFDNASTIKGAAGGMLTGAMVMQGMNNLMRGVKPRGGDNKGGSGKGPSGGDNNNNKINFADNRTPDNGGAENDFIDNTLGAGQSPDIDGNEKPTVGTGNGNDNESDQDENMWDAYMANNDIDGWNGESNDDIPEPEGWDYHEMDGYDGSGYDADDIDSNEIPEANIDVENEDTDKVKPKIKNAVGSALGYTGAAMRLYGPKMLRTAAQVGGAAIIGGTAATIGVAAGLASDDYSNVFKFGAGGAAAGAAAGKIIGDNAVNMGNGATRIPDAFRSTNMRIQEERRKNDPDALKAYRNEQADKEFMRNKEIRKQYQEAFGKEYQKRMEDAQKYRSHGITDNKVIIKAMKNNNTAFLGDDVASDRRIVSAKLASNINNEKDVESVQKRLKDRGVSKENVDKQIKVIRDITGLV